jgi:DNA (cytosine-5)-methyltransferase 1
VPLKKVSSNNKNKKLQIKEEKGGTFSYIINFLKKSGYKVSFNLYNSANFGTPQIRERVIIVGFLDDIKFRFPDISDTKFTLKDAIVDLQKDIEEEPAGLASFCTDYIKTESVDLTNQKDCSR